MHSSDMSPHSPNGRDPQNDRGSIPETPHQTITVSAEEATSSLAAGSVLPRSDVTQTVLEQAKQLLTREVHGISYRTVLASIAANRWYFNGDYMDSPRVTEKIIRLNPELATDFDEKASREGIVQKVLACIPFAGWTLPSEDLLKQVGDVNEMLRDLQRAGLVKIKEYARSIGSHPLDREMYLSRMPPWDIQVSDRGKLALAAE
jgi:hypothetical protein